MSQFNKQVILLTKRRLLRKWARKNVTERRVRLLTKRRSKREMVGEQRIEPFLEIEVKSHRLPYLIVTGTCRIRIKKRRTIWLDPRSRRSASAKCTSKNTCMRKVGSRSFGRWSVKPCIQMHESLQLLQRKCTRYRNMRMNKSSITQCTNRSLGHMSMRTRIGSPSLPPPQPFKSDDHVTWSNFLRISLHPTMITPQMAMIYDL